MFKKLIVLVASITILLGISTSPVHANVSGAIFTTNLNCTIVNQNIFNSKEDVYVDGGPTQPHAGLPDGNYFVQVTEPSGTVLGKSLTAIVTVSGGKFVTCYQLSAILNKASDGTLGYDDTTNNGGVYKVWVSIDPTFPNSSSKTDNFKVEPQIIIPQIPHLLVDKFYDKNTNGTWDAGELEITGWKVNIRDGISYDRFTLVDIVLDPDDYIISEYQPTQTNWIPTTVTSLTKTIVPDGENQVVNFGNVCIGPGGGLSKGFWTNKNGQALFGADDLAQMVSLNLRNANGSNFDPASYPSFKTWLGLANATNMAYMLSAQLSAMKLNVFNGKVNGTALIYAPQLLPFAPIAGLNNLGFINTNNLMLATNNELGSHGTTLSGSLYRSYQEALKNVLDAANNNTTFVQVTPCPFFFAE